MKHLKFIVYILVYICSSIFIGITFFQTKSYLSTLSLIYLFNTFVFFIASLFLKILDSLKIHTYIQCIFKNKNLEILQLIIKYFYWILLLNGISYGFYIFESTELFNILGNIIDAINSIVQIMFVFTILKFLNSSSEC